MRRRIIDTAFAVAVIAFAAGQAVATPVRTGKMSGTVSDENGARIVHARVVAEAGGVRREVYTDTEGVYEAELPARTYTLTVLAPSFCGVRTGALRVAPDAVTSLDFTLRVRVMTEIVNVKGRAVRGTPCIIETPTATPAAVLLASAQARGAKKPAPKPPAKTAARPTAKPRVVGSTVNISTQPGAVVWVDEVRRGVADADGKLSLKVTPGRHTLRVRAKGFAEKSLTLLPAQRGALSVALTQTADEAELLFQQAEEAREKGKNADAVGLYRQALAKRARYAAAHLGLARALESQDNFDDALEELAAARRDRPVYPESWAVEGRIQRSLADHDAALAAYRRALRESGGFQPEAHTGIGIVHEDKGRHEEAADAFRKAIAQLSDTEPVLYELLARNLEKLERWKEAVAAYEKYLELAPQGAHASAINSIIDQLRKQAAEAEQQSPPLD